MKWSALIQKIFSAISLTLLLAYHASDYVKVIVIVKSLPISACKLKFKQLADCQVVLIEGAFLLRIKVVPCKQNS
jgi:hypothetical protein